MDLIATQSANSSCDNEDAIRRSHLSGIYPFANVPTARPIGRAGTREVVFHPTQPSRYTTGAESEYVQNAVTSLRHMQAGPRGTIFVPSHTVATPDIAGELARDTALLQLFQSRDDIVRFISLLHGHPDLLNRTKTLIDAMRVSGFVESIQIETDEEDGDVVVWASLAVEDADRLSVKMSLFEEAQKILGSLSDVILLAMV